MTTIALSGGCACGAVRYECTADPIGGGHCYCRQCQRDSGTDHASHLVVPADAVSINGELRFYDSTADSGNTVSRGFCPTCGSPVMSKNSGMPGMLFFRAASLDDPGLFQPGMVVFTASAPPWGYLDPALPSFEGMPPPREIPSSDRPD